ncbi:MAG: YbaK/EbsC family protein [Pseudomonadota bacterium]
MSAPIVDKIKALLDDEGVAYRSLDHAPTHTSEESAQVRGEDLAIGAKAIVMKAGTAFSLFVISAAQKLDSKKIKKHLGVKKTRFATRDELSALTGLVPGSVPPFGRPIFDLDLYTDPSVFTHDRVAFNAGALTHSIIMQSEDYKRIAKPMVFSFSASE